MRKWRLCYKLGRKVYCRLHSESESGRDRLGEFFFSKDKHELVYRRKNKEFIGCQVQKGNCSSWSQVLEEVDDNGYI